jgi:hypothetical protein
MFPFAQERSSLLQLSAALPAADAAIDPQLLVQPSPVVAEVAHGTAVYTDSSLRKSCGWLDKGTEVIVLRDRRLPAYEVSYGMLSGWVPAETLLIPDDPPTNPHRMTAVPT